MLACYRLQSSQRTYYHAVIGSLGPTQVHTKNSVSGSQVSWWVEASIYGATPRWWKSGENTVLCFLRKEKVDKLLSRQSTARRRLTCTGGVALSVLQRAQMQCIKHTFSYLICSLQIFVVSSQVPLILGNQIGVSVLCSFSADLFQHLFGPLSSLLNDKFQQIVSITALNGQNTRVFYIVTILIRCPLSVTTAYP